MDERLQMESRGLVRSWMQHDDAMLRDYLVRDAEDPRINIQSILTRHFLIELLFSGRYGSLFDRELTFALALHWLQAQARQAGGYSRLQSIMAALLDGESEAGGLPIPHCVRESYANLPLTGEGWSIPNYILEFPIPHPSQADEPRVNPMLSVFEHLWRGLLALPPVAPRTLSVLEPACGSANDYRYLASYGVARFLRYTGFDLCPKNIFNAQGMFPSVDFRGGNVLELELHDKSYDVAFVHDLFEHLSIPALEAAVAELCRVTRHCLCVHFFNMHDSPDHVVNPVGEYHWNALSLPATRALFERQGGTVEVFPIAHYLEEKFGCADYYNPNAFTFIVRL